MPNGYDISRRKVLGGLATIGAAGAGAGMGTTAYFSDEEAFENNTLQAGELDLFVHYTTSVDQGQATGQTNSTTGSGTIQGGVEKQYVINDVKPGDSGSLEFCFSLVDNPGYLWMFGELTDDAEGAVTEPEGDTPWERDGGPSGELATYTRASLYYTGDTSDDNDDDVLITEGTLLGVLADLQAGLPLHGNGDPTAGVLNRPAFDGGSDSSSPTDDTCVRLDWEVPTWIGNEIQADSVAFNLSFYAEQERHNDGSGPATVVQPSDDLQAAINDASSGDTLLLAAGTHSGSVTVDTAVNIRGEGPSNTIFDGGGSSRGMDVKVGGIRIGDLTGTNAGQAISINDGKNSGGRVSGVILSNIVADGNSDRAIVLDYTDEALVRDIVTANNGNDGLTLWYTNDSHVETVVANDNGDNGIYFNGDGNILVDSEAKRNADEGVDVNWYDDLGPDTQRVTLDNVVAMDNDEDDVELHDNGTDDAVADDSMLLRKVETGGAPTGLRMVQVDESEVRVEQSSFPNGQLDGNDNDVDP